MPRRNTRSRSSDSSDPGDAALEAQRRILKLKKERDENIKAVAAESEAALAELRAKVIAWHEDLQRQRAERRQHCLTEIIQHLERRESMEDKMVAIVNEARATVVDLEAMMLAGYQGREKDVASAMEKVMGYQHGI
ncbi:hypothetical protein V8C37DRAFT_390187 [Trichoderma ceciliae]